MRSFGFGAGVLALCLVCFVAQVQLVESRYGGSVRRLGEYGDDVSEWKFGKDVLNMPWFLGLNLGIFLRGWGKFCFVRSSCGAGASVAYRLPRSVLRVMVCSGGLVFRGQKLATMVVANLHGDVENR